MKRLLCLFGLPLVVVVWFFGWCLYLIGSKKSVEAKLSGMEEKK